MGIQNEKYLAPLPTAVRLLTDKRWKGGSVAVC